MFILLILVGLFMAYQIRMNYFYDEMETFFESHNDYDAGIIDFEILKEKSKKNQLWT